MKYLSEIIKVISCTVENFTRDTEIHDISCKSFECKQGFIFAALKGENADGHDYVFDAYEKGCRAFLVESKLNLPADATQIITQDSRKALAVLSLFIFDNPHMKLKIIGITGTKGKSIVVAMINRILSFSGIKCCSISTIGADLGTELIRTENSTPESYIIARLLKKMVDLDTKVAVLEVSSQGIKQNRIHGLNFDAKAITNLSNDHIGKGEHSDFEEYKNCKRVFLSGSIPCFINSDDKYYAEFKSIHPHKTYGIESDSDFKAKNIEIKKLSCGYRSEFDLVFNGQTHRVSIAIPGTFAVYNALTAISVCNHFGVSIETSALALEGFTVEGRFEKVKTEQDDFDIVIDYAHNEASLENALSTARMLTSRRVILVTGSVGERTEIRRKGIGKVADKLSDYCVITSDNPNRENPEVIALDIAGEIYKTPYKIILNRKEAIRHAINEAQNGDLILIAGKGHERYQLINGKKIQFDERDIIKETIKDKIKI